MLALSNDNLITSVRLLVKEERRITREILDHINEVARRRLYADLGFSSIFDWLVKDLSYSESAAYRRMQAARVLLAVPEAAGKLESGALGLTVLSKVQTFIRADEKRTGQKMSIQEKSEILTKVESCSGREAEHRLAQHFPEVASQFPDGLAPKEKVRAISEDQVSVQVTFTRVQFEKLKRIQELLSHTHRGSSHAEFLDAAMDVFLEKKDPLRKAVKPRAALCDTAAEADVPDVQPAKSLTPSIRNAVLRKSGGQCEYRETKMGHRCESRHFLEIDHIQPRALGGTNVPDNLRVLCRTHNLLVAERVFGREKIEAFRRRM
ncbi:MAG: HNH endonuclease [Deltaproteobacteria bacterium]|nr:HNH endonuclease [Deltaproteobacteria bacterium]